VKLDRLAARLHREVVASPKKAALLGLLFVVAVIYWMPLLWGWIRPESTETSAKTASAPASGKGVPAVTKVPAMKPVAMETPASQTSGSSKHTWREVAGWIESDPRMTTASHPPGRTHPFDPVEPPASEPAETEGGPKAGGKEEAIADLAQDIADPASLGLVLSSTIVGNESPAALINGKSYRLGEAVRLDHNKQTIEFQLVNIRADSVVLQRGERQYEVCLPEPAASGRLKMNVLPNH